MGTAENIKIYLLMALFAAVLFNNLGGWDLWNPDEPRYGQVAREMMETGQYTVPHLNGESYPDKPPLFFWLVTLASIPFGDVNTFSARFPSALGGLGLVLLTYFFSKMIFDQLTGLLAAAILFLNGEFFFSSISVHIDTVFALWIFLALFLFYVGYARINSRKYFVFSYVCMGLAVLTKGPVGLLIPLLSIFLFLLSRGDIKRIKNIELGKGIIIAAGIVAAWLVPACIKGGEEYTRDILFQQTFGRAVNSYSHNAPFFYYLYKFPVGFLPWSLFIPAALVYFWKNKKGKLNIAFPLAWFAGSFIFFSLVSCKRSLYLIPAFPAASMLIAKFWSDNIRKDNTDSPAGRLKSLKIPSLLFLGALFIVSFLGTGVLFADKFNMLKPLIPISRVLYPAFCLIALACIASILLTIRAKRVKFLFYIISTDILILFIIIVLAVFPSINIFKSARPFCKSIEKIVTREDKLIALFEPDLFNYFLHRYPIPKIEGPESLESLLSSPEKIYLLLKEKHYIKATEKFKHMVTILSTDQIGHTKYFLAVNRARHD